MGIASEAAKTLGVGILILTSLIALAFLILTLAAMEHPAWFTDVARYVAIFVNVCIALGFAFFLGHIVRNH